jgi:fructose-1,6-bisphosphatase/inositol monophosphatase family enzyme/glutathione synthase/RimK-type ligase-like ATP-grasp enzyme
MRVCMLMVKHPPERKSPIMPEVLRLLRERGVVVDVVFPDEELVDLAQVRVEHDLYVLKSGTETALSLAGALHAQGAKILNPYPAAAALRDKVVATRVLQRAGVPIPDSYVTSDPGRLAPLLEAGPLIVKPFRGSQGRGIRVVRSAQDLGTVEVEGGMVFAQRYHPSDGRDRKVYCIGRRIFGVSRVWPPRTYEDKIGQPFEVGPDLAAIARRCGEAFGLDLFGVDVVVSDGRPYVVDMQGFPGFKGVPGAAEHLADAILAADAGGLELERELQVATRLALEAGAILRERRVGPLEVSHKENGEPVTAADVESDRLIRAGLTAAFPRDAVFSEETPDSAARLPCARVWIVDPLDATSNYAERGDEYCVSIGLSISGRPALGVVYNPARRELVAGYRGAGVTLNGSSAAVRDLATLDGARLHVSRKEWRRGLRERAASLPIEPMASMAYKLARVAAGLSDGTFSLVPRKEWGTCAGVALVLAAGGRATLLDGAEISFNRSAPRQGLGMVAAGPRLHPLLLGALREGAGREAVA